MGSSKETAKERARRKGWANLKKAGAARFPFPVEGRIPNFKGAEAAARHLHDLTEWNRATVIKCNPDSPQLPVRLQALKDGKRIYIAVPRLRKKKCFLELDPDTIAPENYRKAVSIKGAAAFGRPVDLEEMRPIDLVVTGCVAVSADGARVGKGGGYSDLEFGLGRETDLIPISTPVLTTVHPSQVIERDWETAPHDIPLDFILTPEKIVETHHAFEVPEGLYWDLISEEKRRDIPVLNDNPLLFDAPE